MTKQLVNIENNKHGRLVSNTVMQYGLQIAKYIFPLVSIPYLTRVLGKETYAVRAYILAAMSFCQVFLDYGFNAYGTKAIAENLDNTRGKNAQTSSIVFLRLFLSIIGFPIVLALARNLPIMNSHKLFVCLSYVTVCFKAMLPDFIFQGEEDMGIITRRFVVSQAIGTSLIFLIVKKPSDLIFVALLEGFAALIALIWSWADVFFSRGYILHIVTIDMLKQVFSQSSIFFLSNAATTIFTSITTIMIGIYISDSSQISYWSLSMNLITAIQSLFTPITNSLYPHMVINKDIKVVRVILLFGLPIVIIGSIALYLLSDLAMYIVGGVEYVEGSYILGAVSPILVFSFPAMVLGFPVLAASGHEKELTSSSTISATFHIAGLIFLVNINAFTIINIAILRVITESVLLFTRLYYVYIYKDSL